MRQCRRLLNPVVGHVQLVQSCALQLESSTAAVAIQDGSSSLEHAARLESSLHCTTSTSHVQVQQTRHYAAGGGSGNKTPVKPAVAAMAAAAPEPSGGDLSPPEFKLKHIPQSFKGDPVARLTPAQKALLEGLIPDGKPLRSLRQLGWNLGPRETMALMHEQLSDMDGTNVKLVPFVVNDLFASAAILAGEVKDMLEDGQGMAAVQQRLLTEIANMSDVPFEGLKIQLKGRMSGKGGMASKKAWIWGRTAKKTVHDIVDCFQDALVTRAGYISIKVWIKYKPSHVAPKDLRIPQSYVNTEDLLSMPPITALPSRSSSSWWSRPSTLQPQQHQSWECFSKGYRPELRHDQAIEEMLRRQKQQQQQQQQQQQTQQEAKEMLAG